MSSEVKEKLETSAMEEDAAAEEEEEEMEEDEEEDGGDDDEEDEAVTHGRRSGRGLTLMTLLKEKVLQPGLGNMTINYLGNKFKGDLLTDGRIRSQETGKIFGTPSAWAIYCKQIVNPNKKSGCGWASVKYRGKKLDEYKNNWNRQKRLEFEKEGDDIECLGEEEIVSCSESEAGDINEHEVLDFDILGTRNDPTYAGNPFIELTSFSNLGRLQPFTVAASSSAMAVVDLHVHLTKGEAVGFLAGQWDVNNHNLIVSHAFPLCWENPPSVSGFVCGSTNNNNNNNSISLAAGQAAEEAIHKQMASLKLALVGWYHSHPHGVPLPSLKDIDTQLDYEMRMKGSNDASYTPCIGFVVSPFHEYRTHHHSRNASFQSTTNVVPPDGSTLLQQFPSSTATPASLSVASLTSSPAAPVTPTPPNTLVTTLPLSTPPHTATSVTTLNGGISESPKAASVAAASDSSLTVSTPAAVITASTAAATTASTGAATTLVDSQSSVAPAVTTNTTSHLPVTLASSSPIIPPTSAAISSAPIPPPLPLTPQHHHHAGHHHHHHQSPPIIKGLTSMSCFWVMPPPEHRPHEYPRPMSIIYNVVQDAFVPKEALVCMRECVKYYSKSDEAIDMHETYSGSVTYWDKLKAAIKARVPKDHFAPLIEYLHKILRIKIPLPDLTQPPSPVPLKEEPKPEVISTVVSSAANSANAIASLNSLLLKSKDSGVASSPSSRALLAGGATVSEVRSRPYPDPSKIHPLLVDRSDERPLQPLILDRGAPTNAGAIANIAAKANLSDKTEESKVQIHHILTDPPADGGSNGNALSAVKTDAVQTETNNSGIPLPASQNPPDYPFPLLRTMAAEQASNIQKQQEQRYEEELMLQKEKLQGKPGQVKQMDTAIPLQSTQLAGLERDVSVDGKMLSNSDDNNPLHIALTKDLQKTVANTPTVFSIGDSITPKKSQPPPYSSKNIDDRRCSPPPYQAPKVTVRELPLYPTIPADFTRKEGSNEGGTSAATITPVTTAAPSVNFSALGLIGSSSNSSSSSVSILPHTLAVTSAISTSASTPSGPSFGSSSITAGSNSLTITSVSRTSANHSNNTSPSLTITSSALNAASPLSLNPFYSGHANALGSSTLPPLPGAPSPLLSPSPFSAPRTNSPATVEVSPRHTEWAQNALSGMSRSPLISVKSQAALSQPPSSSSSSNSGSGSNSVSITGSSLATDMLPPPPALPPTASSLPSLAESLAASSAAAAAAANDPWLQASLAAGLSQYPGFSSSQFSKAAAAAAAAQFSEHQQNAFTAAYHSMLQPSVSSASAAAEQLLLQHQQQDQNK